MTTGGSKVRTRVVLDDGMIMEGTPEQIKKHLEMIGFSGDTTYYFSKTRGLIKIEEMESTHLRNAILKKYSEWIDSLHKIADPRMVVRKIVEGNPDLTFIAMVEELNRR